MRALFIRKDYNGFERKIIIDMAYLVTHKKIRLSKTYFEDGLYLLFLPNAKSDQKNVEKYYLSKDKIVAEDEFHYFFNFPFKPEQVEPVSV